MEIEFIDDQNFEGIDYTKSPLKRAHYESCRFSNCNFAGTDLSQIIFEDCEFTECDLSSANVFNTGFQKVIFTQCKMLGLLFEKCSDFSLEISASECQLDHSSFYQKNIYNN